MSQAILIKKNGSTEPFSETKLRNRLERLLGGPDLTYHGWGSSLPDRSRRITPYKPTPIERLDTKYVSIDEIVRSVTSGLTNKMTTAALDELIAEQCASLGTRHPDYSRLAGRIAVTALHKQTSPSFTETANILRNFQLPDGTPAPLLSDTLHTACVLYGAIIDAHLDHTRDLRLDFFGYKTLERSYLLRVGGRRIAERPQHLLMRVALGIHADDLLPDTTTAPHTGGDAGTGTLPTPTPGLVRALETYDLMSQGYFTHASPTLFAAGTPKPQMSSCFLVAMKEDSIEGIYDTLKECAMISKAAGGIGLHVHNIRARGSYIRGTNGISNGLVPMLRVFNQTSRYVDQGGGKRKGAFAIYLEPWHADIFDFLNLKKNTGKEEHRARDLFYGLWIPDLFMKRVESNSTWSLMCPNQCPGLSDVWGEEFEKLYTKYESEGRYVRQVSARELWLAVISSQIETGTPYLLYKDSANRKSNQQNLGTIKCSNLCTEIIEYTSPEETAVCNLASISLPAFIVYPNSENTHTQSTNIPNISLPTYPQLFSVQTPPHEAFARATSHMTDTQRKEFFGPQPTHRPDTTDTDTLPWFDFAALYTVVRTVTRNLNKVIDNNYYPVPTAARSNLRHRPVGLGVQGLADVFHIMRLPFSSPQAKQLNIDIFETIYFAALDASADLAAEFGSPYPSYHEGGGCPVSRGVLQPDMWGVVPGTGTSAHARAQACRPPTPTATDTDTRTHRDTTITSRWDWAGLRARIATHGVRNSLLVAPMPTASTSQILGNNECFEPYTTNIYIRRCLSGEFPVVNRHLVGELSRMGLWNEEVRELIIAGGGSVQHMTFLPPHIRERFLTVWEMKQRDLIDMAADRAPYVDQSQSLNLFVQEPTTARTTSMHFYAWKRGLKTGMYYLRIRPAADAIKFTVSPEVQARVQALYRGLHGPSPAPPSATCAPGTDTHTAQLTRHEKDTEPTAHTGLVPGSPAPGAAKVPEPTPLYPIGTPHRHEVVQDGAATATPMPKSLRGESPQTQIVPMQTPPPKRVRVGADAPAPPTPQSPEEEGCLMCGS